MTNASTPVLLSSGNPQIAKGEGDAPVQAYIAAMPEWKSAVGRRIDTLVEHVVPGVHKAVKWNTPFYGNPGDGWFLALYCYRDYVQITFFRGQSLTPIPPVASKSGDTRYFNIYEKDALDEAQLADWVMQASGLPGERL